MEATTVKKHWRKFVIVGVAIFMPTPILVAAGAMIYGKRVRNLWKNSLSRIKLTEL